MQDKEIKYSQNEEQKFITEYFKGLKGTLLDIGANDGKTFSNSLRLIEIGWHAVLVEPSNEAFDKLSELHRHKPNVICLPCAIGAFNSKSVLHVSGHHLPDKSDHSLLSTLNPYETKKWKNVEFTEQEIDVITYKELQSITGINSFDFITVDAEGVDIVILKQIDLTNIKLLCIEWNSIPQIKNEILEYTSKFGMKNIIYQNQENLIISK